MSRRQEKNESDDDFQYEEVVLEDDFALTEGEENLEATLKAIKDRAASSRANTASSLNTAEPVDDFLRNFLFQMGMTETLDCFQTEWTEMSQKGLLNTEQNGLIPEAYTENRRLESALKNAQREREEYREAGSAAAQMLQKVQKARDFHKLQHRRLVQEKSRLIEEMRKLKTQCDSYEPEVKRMDEKYKAVLKKTMLVSLEKDKATSAQSSIPNCGDTAGEDAVNTARGTSIIGPSQHVIQPRPPSSARSQRASPRRTNKPT